VSTPIIINTAAIQYRDNTTECHCSITADTIIGESTVTRVIVLDSATLAVDWTDVDLCTAIATHLNVPVEDVSVAVPLT